jgi:hypothetical protein
MTDQEFKDLRSMVERRVREARSRRFVGRDKRMAHFEKKILDERIGDPGRSSTNGSRDPQVLRKS